jgi:hypothetical protein
MRYNTLLVSTALATSGSAAAVKQSRQLPATVNGLW